MTGLGLTALVQLAMLATSGEETYADAHRATNETGRPMVVMVTADWCAACQQMKNDVIPQCRQRGLLRRVAFAIVNLDRERDLGTQLTAGGPIPQLLVYRRTGEGWRMNRLIGGQSVEAIEDVIKEAEASAKTAKDIKTEKAVKSDKVDSTAKKEASSPAKETSEKTVAKPVSDQRPVSADKNAPPKANDQVPPPVQSSASLDVSKEPLASTSQDNTVSHN